MRSWGHRLRAQLLLFVFLVLSCIQARAETYDAFLEPSRTIHISTPQRDRLDTIHVQQGSQVKTGALLAELSTGILQAQQTRARKAANFHGAVDAAKAKIAMQANRLNMLNKLKKSGNTRPQELLAAQTELALAQAQLQVAKEEQELRKQELAIIEAQIEEKKLRSPINGVVIEINQEPAELIGGGDQAPFMTLVQLEPLTALFHLPYAQTQALKRGQPLSLQANNQQITGTIAYIAPVIAADSGTVEVKIEITNAHNQLISGSRCSLKIEP